MPLTNYFNPESNFPQYGGNPVMQAFHGPEQMDIYRQLSDLQRALANEELTKQRDVNETYRLDAPVREAARAPAISGSQLQDQLNRGAMNEPGYAQWAARKVIGQGMQEYAKGEVANRTIDSNVAKEDTSNIAASLENAAHILQMTHAAGNLQGVQQQWSQIRKSLPPQVQAAFPEMYTPEVPGALQQLAAAAINSPAHSRNVQITGMNNASAERVGAGHDAASMYAADQRLSAAYLRLPAQTRNKLESVLANILEKMAEGKATQQDAAVFQTIQQIMYNMRPGQSIDPQLLNFLIMSGQQIPPQAPPRPVPAPVPAPAGTPGATAPNTNPNDPMGLR